METRQLNLIHVQTIILLFILVFTAGNEKTKGIFLQLLYSGTPLIRPSTGLNKLAVLTGWLYYQGRIKSMAKGP